VDDWTKTSETWEQGPYSVTVRWSGDGPLTGGPWEWRVRGPREGEPHRTLAKGRAPTQELARACALAAIAGRQ
jgi:hypothetical protein